MTSDRPAPLPPYTAAEAAVRRFWTHVTPDDSGCWIWTAALNHGGYGHTSNVGGTTLAHRVAWFLTHGSVPKGLSLDHLCRNTRCVNPGHLDPVPQSVNRARVKVVVRLRPRCKNGHEFSPENTRYHVGAGHPQRVCRACSRHAHTRYMARRRAAR